METGHRKKVFSYVIISASEYIKFPCRSLLLTVRLCVWWFCIMYLCNLDWFHHLWFTHMHTKIFKHIDTHLRIIICLRTQKCITLVVHFMHLVLIFNNLDYLGARKRKGSGLGPPAHFSLSLSLCALWSIFCLVCPWWLPFFLFSICFPRTHSETSESIISIPIRCHSVEWLIMVL